MRSLKCELCCFGNFEKEKGMLSAVQAFQGAAGHRGPGAGSENFAAWPWGQALPLWPQGPSLYKA